MPDAVAAHEFTNHKGSGKLINASNFPQKGGMYFPHKLIVDTISLTYDGLEEFCHIKPKLEKEGIAVEWYSLKVSSYTQKIILKMKNQQVAVILAYPHYYKASRYFITIQASQIGYAQVRKLINIFDKCFSYFLDGYSMKVSRIDLAYDVPDSIHKFHFHLKRSQRIYKFDNHTTFPSLYLGSKKSGLMLHVYDKKDQLWEEKHIKVIHPLTRIELRVRKRIPLNELLDYDVKSIFEKLVVFEKKNFKIPHPALQKLPVKAFYTYLHLHEHLESFNKGLKLVKGSYQKNQLLAKHGNAVPEWLDISSLEQQYRAAIKAMGLIKKPLTI